MKSIKTLIILFAGLSFFVTCNAQKESEIRLVSSFKSIKVSSGINLYLTQGNEHKVTVEADVRHIFNIITETKGNVLNIYYSGKIPKTNGQFNVYVTASWLESIEVTSGADLYCEQRLKLEKLTVRSSSGADARVDVECRDLALYASSGADIKVKGTTLNLTASSSSGSDINANELEAVNANLEASSGSDIVAKVIGEIEASASSGADITYYGDAIPKMIRQSSGGDVRKR